MTHLPDCDDYAFSGAGYHPNCERICICRQVRRIEKRVLDAAQEAVQKWISYTFPGHRPGWTQQISSTIDALCR